MTHTPLDPDFVQRVHDSFARQQVMNLVGARLIHIAAGECVIELPYREDLTQQHGYFHAGITATIADSAGGYAAFTLFPPRSNVLSVEFKINLIAPANGERLSAQARVVKHGRTLTIVEFEVFVLRNGEEHRCAIGLQTVMCVPEKEKPVTVQ